MATASAADEGSTAVVELRGEIDLTCADDVRRAATSALGAGSTTLVFDLSAVTFLDSQGINALVAARQQMQHAGGSVMLRRPPPIVQRVLELTGLDGVFRIDP